MRVIYAYEYGTHPQLISLILFTHTHNYTVAGVSIMVGFVRGSADAVKFQSGAGGTHATMTGVNNRHSGAETGYSINGAFFGLGGSNYVSSGTNFVQAIPRIGTYLTASSNGAGLASFIGAGTSTNSYTGQLSVQMIRFNAGVATDLFTGAGWLVSVRSKICCLHIFPFGLTCFVRTL